MALVTLPHLGARNSQFSLTTLYSESIRSRSSCDGVVFRSLAISLSLALRAASQRERTRLNTSTDRWTCDGGSQVLSCVTICRLCFSSPALDVVVGESPVVRPRRLVLRAFFPHEALHHPPAPVTTT